MPEQYAISIGDKDCGATIHRYFGVVMKRTVRTATLKLANGEKLTRPISHVAFYVRPPSNILDLIKRQEVATPRLVGKHP